MSQYESRIHIKVSSPNIWSRFTDKNDAGFDLAKLAETEKTSFVIDGIWSAHEDELTRIVNTLAKTLDEDGIIIADTTNSNVDPFNFCVLYLGENVYTELFEDSEFDRMAFETTIDDISKWLNYGEFHVSEREKSILFRCGILCIDEKFFIDCSSNIEFQNPVALRETSFESRPETIEKTRVGEDVYFVHSMSDYDPLRLEVMSHSGSLGYLPSNVSDKLTPFLLNNCLDYIAKVEEIIPVSQRNKHARSSIVVINIEAKTCDSKFSIKTSETHVNDQNIKVDKVSEKQLIGLNTFADIEQEAASENIQTINSDPDDEEYSNTKYPVKAEKVSVSKSVPFTQEQYAYMFAVVFYEKENGSFNRIDTDFMTLYSHIFNKELSNENIIALRCEVKDLIRAGKLDNAKSYLTISEEAKKIALGKYYTDVDKVILKYLEVKDSGWAAAIKANSTTMRAKTNPQPKITVDLKKRQNIAFQTAEGYVYLDTIESLEKAIALIKPYLDDDETAVLNRYCQTRIKELEAEKAKKVQETPVIEKAEPEQKKEGCYIATAVYGSYNAPEVIILRRFRDDVLQNSVFGRLFIKAYYCFSPFVAEKLKTAKHINSLVRNILDKFIQTLK